MEIGEIYIGKETGVEIRIAGVKKDQILYEFCNALEGFTGVNICTKEDFERSTRLKEKSINRERTATGTEGNGKPAATTPENCRSTDRGTAD